MKTTMKRNEKDPQDPELVKSHLIVSIIRTQEEADRVLKECEKLESLKSHIMEAIHCRKTAEYLQRKANCYVKKYLVQKKRQSGEE